MHVHVTTGHARDFLFVAKSQLLGKAFRIARTAMQFNGQPQAIRETEVIGTISTDEGV